MQFVPISEIEFGVTGNAQRFQRSGWSNPEESFTWSVGPYAELLIPRKRTRGQSFIFIRLCPFLHPPEMISQRLVIEIDGSIAFSSRCWGDHRLAIRFALDQAEGEFSILIARFPDARKPSEFRIKDDRLLAFKWRSVQIVCQDGGQFMESIYKPSQLAQAQLLSITNTLEKWAEEEIKPWLFHRPYRLECEFLFAHLNATTHWSAIYRFYDGNVEFIPKPSHIDRDPVIFDRAQYYLKFFKALMFRLPAEFDATICVCVADYPMRVAEVPIFAFQKSAGMETILLPDIDFLIHEFFSDTRYRDNNSYFTKEIGAVFVGSTTGGDISAEVARSASLPRLRAATHFSNSQNVHFYLPNIVQCTSQEAENILRSESFCQKPTLTWQEQCHYRFQISIDGNGAACSRLALCLSSNSALLKYESTEQLYYFHGLIPWVHFVPIACDSDIENIICEEIKSPGRFCSIAKNGRQFATEFLNKEQIESYTAILLTKYAAIFAS